MIKKSSQIRYLMRSGLAGGEGNVGTNYLLEPELIYTSGKMDDDSICLMYYPDVKRLGGARKLMLFAERIRNDSSREEREVFDQFRLNIESSDLNRAVLYLDKIILRMESRMLGAAS